MFRRENKNLGNLRGAVQTWLNSYARLNTEAKRANRNTPIDPTTLRGNVGLIKSIRKYVALKTLVNQMPVAPPMAPPVAPQFNRTAINAQIRRIEQDLRTIILTQTAATNKLAQLTRIQAAINKFKSEVGPMPKNITNKFAEFNRAITVARNSLGTPAAPVRVQQAAANLVKVANDPTLGEIFKTPQGGLLARGFQANRTGRILTNAYYKVQNIGGGQLRWSANNKAYNYNRASGNIRPKTAPALPNKPNPPPLPMKPDEYTNRLLEMYPNNILNSLNVNKLMSIKTQFATRPNFNRQNVGNKILAIQAAINRKEPWASQL
jgi:hypothetical protein